MNVALNPKSLEDKESKLPKLQEQLEQAAAKPLQLIPIGIIDSRPITDALHESAKLTAEAMHETADTLKSLKETVDSTVLSEKIDRLTAIFSEIRDNEKAFFAKVEAELR
jgi:Asp-tRNA(Asn)/Glu-tRNA(Gln) amidotransferase A subunit family amidase